VRSSFYQLRKEPLKMTNFLTVSKFIRQMSLQRFISRALIITSAPLDVPIEFNFYTFNKLKFWLVLYNHSGNCNYLFIISLSKREQACKWRFFVASLIRTHLGMRSAEIQFLGCFYIKI